MRRRGAPQSLHGFAIEQCERANRTGRAAPMVPLSAPLHCPSAHPPSPSLPKNRATLVGPVPTPPNRIRAGNHVFSGRQRDSRAPRQRTPRAGTPLASGDRVAVVWRPRGGRLPLTSWSAVGSHGRHRRQAVCRRCTARGFPNDTGHKTNSTTRSAPAGPLDRSRSARHQAPCGDPAADAVRPLDAAARGHRRRRRRVARLSSRAVAGLPPRRARTWRRSSRSAAAPATVHRARATT